MTGTSLDGLDAAAVRVEGRGLTLRATVLRTLSRPLGALSGRLRAAAEQRPMSAGEFAQLALDVGLAHARAIRPLVRSLDVNFVVVHGQTVFHQPPASWQLINPWPIVHALRVPVLFDLRGADLAAGGQGAPITPLADHLLLRHARETRVVVNLGGFINYTRVPAGRRSDLSQVRAGDVCACNQVLDAVARGALGQPFDRGGRAALRGQVVPSAMRALVHTLGRQARSNRSLGTGDEAAAWVAAHRRVGGPNLARTACAAIAHVLAERVGRADRYLLAGGGVRNAALVAEVRARLSPVDLLDEHGVPGQHREAIAMAVLGALCDDGVPITLPQVTGGKRVAVSGAWAGRNC